MEDLINKLHQRLDAMNLEVKDSFRAIVDALKSQDKKIDFVCKKTEFLESAVHSLQADTAEAKAAFHMAPASPTSLLHQGDGLLPRPPASSAPPTRCSTDVLDIDTDGRRAKRDTNTLLTGLESICTAATPLSATTTSGMMIWVQGKASDLSAREVLDEMLVKSDTTVIVASNLGDSAAPTKWEPLRHQGISYIYVRDSSQLWVSTTLSTPMWTWSSLIAGVPSRPAKQPRLLLDRPPPWPLWKASSMCCITHGRAWLLPSPSHPPKPSSTSVICVPSAAPSTMSPTIQYIHVIDHVVTIIDNGQDDHKGLLLHGPVYLNGSRVVGLVTKPWDPGEQLIMPWLYSCLCCQVNIFEWIWQQQHILEATMVSSEPSPLPCGNSLDVSSIYKHKHDHAQLDGVCTLSDFREQSSCLFYKLLVCNIDVLSCLIMKMFHLCGSMGLTETTCADPKSHVSQSLGNHLTSSGGILANPCVLWRLEGVLWVVEAWWQTLQGVQQWDPGIHLICWWLSKFCNEYFLATLLQLVHYQRAKAHRCNLCIPPIQVGQYHIKMYADDIGALWTLFIWHWKVLLHIISSDVNVSLLRPWDPGVVQRRGLGSSRVLRGGNVTPHPCHVLGQEGMDLGPLVHGLVAHTRPAGRDDKD